jgi:predicted transcriptional regulator
MDFKKVLLQTNLTPSQAEILEFLYQNKEAKAGEIAKKINRSRAIVYKEIEELANISLIERKDKPGQASVFMAGHPSLLQKLIEKSELELKKDRELLNNYLPDMISSYNLMQNKPGVRYYEGKEGMIDALDYISKDFQDGDEIISFVKVLPVEYEKDINEAFADFIKKRIKKNVKTRVVSLDTPEGQKLKENDFNSLRETRLTKAENLPLNFSGGEMFIYKDKICTITAENNLNFAFTVQNKAIAYLLATFFNSCWSMLE